MASYPRVAATRATLIRRSEPSKLAPPEDKARLQGDATSTTTTLLYDLVRRCLDYADCRGLGVWPGRGVDHSGRAGRATQRSHTDAGLHRQLLPQGVDPCTPREATGRREVRAERNPCYPNNNSSNAAKTDKARRRGRAWPSQRLRYTRRVYRRGHGLCRRPHTHITIIMHGEREAKTTKTTTQLNRRYLA